MNQTAKLALAFVGAGVASNLLARGIIASATTVSEPPLLFKATTALGLVGGGALAWSLRDDPFKSGKDMAITAAVVAGISGGFLAAGMSVVPSQEQPQQLGSGA